MAGIAWLMTACTSTAYFRTSSGYTDDLYGAPRETVSQPEPSYAVVRTESERPASAVQNSRSVPQNPTEEIDMNQYYPGMFEEALTGTIEPQPETEYATKSAKNDDNNIIININYENPWAEWNSFYYRPSWYVSNWGWGFSWGPSWSWNYYNPWWTPWYDPWYDPWYRPWYGYYGWYDPWYNPWHGHYYRPWHTYYDSRYRNRIAYTGNRRPGNTMIGSRPGHTVISSRPASTQTRHSSYESALTTRRPGTGSTVSSRPGISGTNRPTQDQINSSRVTTRRSGTRTEYNSSNSSTSRRPANNNSNTSSRPLFNNNNSSSSSRPSFSNPTPIRTPSGSFNRGSSSGMSRGSGISSGGGGGVRRR